MLSQVYFEQGDWQAPEVADVFDRYGVVVVKRAVEAQRIEGLTRALKHLFAARLASLGIVVHDREDLDRLYEQLIADDAKHVGEIFVLVRQLVEHSQLIFSPQILALVNTLIPNSILQVIPEACGMRIDGCGDSTRTFGWHHDYSFLAMSLNGITGWAPLAPLTSEMGWLRVVPGSHKTITPVIFHESYATQANFKGHRAYELRVDERELEVRGVDIVDVAPGDILFIHSCLLHRSGRNVSDRARWTVLPRYGDALDPAVVARGWQAIRGEATPRLFNELHPDLVEVRTSVG